MFFYLVAVDEAECSPHLCLVKRVRIRFLHLLLLKQRLDGEPGDAGLHGQVDGSHLGLDGVLAELMRGEEANVAEGSRGDSAVEDLSVVALGEFVGEIEARARLSAGDAEEPPAGVALLVVLDLRSVQVDVSGGLARQRDAHGGVAGGGEEESLGGGDHLFLWVVLFVGVKESSGRGVRARGVITNVALPRTITHNYLRVNFVGKRTNSIKSCSTQQPRLLTSRNADWTIDV